MPDFWCDIGFSTIFIRCFDLGRSCFTRILWTIDTKSEQRPPPTMVVCLEDDWRCDAVHWSCFGWRTLTTDTQTRHHRCYCDDGWWFQGDDGRSMIGNLARCGVVWRCGPLLWSSHNTVWVWRFMWAGKDASYLAVVIVLFIAFWLHIVKSHLF